MAETPTAPVKTLSGPKGKIRHGFGLGGGQGYTPPTSESSLARRRHDQQAQTGETAAPPETAKEPAAPPEHAEAPKPSLIRQAQEMLQAEALKPDGKFNLLDESKIKEMVEVQMAAKFAQRPNIDKNGDEYKAALKTATDSLVTQNAANKHALEFINPGTEQTSLLAQVNDQGERIVDQEFENKATGEVIREKRPVNELSRIQDLLTKLGGEGTALALQIDQARQIRRKVGDSTHTLTRGQFVELKMQDAQGTPDQLQTMREEVNRAFDAKAIVVEKLPEKAQETNEAATEADDPQSNMTRILNDELQFFMDRTKKDRKDNVPYVTLISDSLAEEEIFKNDAQLLTLEQLLKHHRKIDRPENIDPVTWETRINKIEGLIGYLKGEGAGKADAVARLVRYHYEQKGLPIPDSLQEILKTKHNITYKELRQAWVEYRLDRNNKQVRDIINGKTKLKDPKNATGFIDYILQNKLLAEMQKYTRALANAPVDSESVKQYSTQILNQLHAEVNDRSLEYMQLLLLGNKDKGVAVVTGVTLVGVIAAALQNLGNMGVTATYDQPQ